MAFTVGRNRVTVPSDCTFSYRAVKGCRVLKKWRGCWDCEIPLSPDDLARNPKRALCDSCEEHRADEHAPAALLIEGDTKNARTTRAEYCHGAGPRGAAYRLLKVPPAPIRVERRGGRKSPHTYRVAVAL